MLKIAYEKFFPVPTFKAVFRNFETEIFDLELCALYTSHPCPM